MYDSKLILEDASGTAKIATGQSTPITVDLSTSIVQKAVINLMTADIADTNETYTFSIEVDDAADSGFVEVASVTLNATAPVIGIYELGIMGSLVEILKPNATKARIVWTLGGTTPSTTFVAGFQPADK